MIIIYQKKKNILYQGAEWTEEQLSDPQLG